MYIPIFAHLHPRRDRRGEIISAYHTHMAIYIYIYIYIYVHIDYAYVCALPPHRGEIISTYHTHTWLSIYLYTHTYMYVYIHIYIHIDSAYVCASLVLLLLTYTYTTPACVDLLSLCLSFPTNSCLWRVNPQYVYT